MNLNADFSARASVHAATLPWVPSPIPGVDRRMLDRIGDEVARATSIVRYEPSSQFSPHTHGGGEEFLVLDGVFQDEHGDYPAGSYLRNPPDSRHTPGSAPGCTIYVKLWQFEPADRHAVRLDTFSLALTAVAPGVQAVTVFQDGREHVTLERWDAGAVVERPLHGGIELLVLEGTLTEGGEVFGVQSWLRLPAGDTLRAVAGEYGCRVWVKAGHLATPPASTVAVYKILTAAEFAQLQDSGTFAGAPIDLADGYIHLSSASQTAETLEKHFSDQTGLVIASVSLALLGAALRWEPSRGGRLFPHLYGHLGLANILASGPVDRSSDGRLTLPG